jgi:hypothetical protein
MPETPTEPAEQEPQSATPNSPPAESFADRLSAGTPASGNVEDRRQRLGTLPRNGPVSSDLDTKVGFESRAVALLGTDALPPREPPGQLASDAGLHDIGPKRVVSPRWLNKDRARPR